MLIAEKGRTIRVKVTTNAKNETLTPTRAGFTISVRAEPKGNRANECVLGLLARALSISRKKLSITSGHHRSSKLVFIRE